MQWHIILALLWEIGVVLSTLHIKQCVEKRGKPVLEFNKMPKWWQKLRMHLNVS